MSASATPSRPGPIQRPLLALSVPLAATQLANIALAATDTAVLGHVGIGALAGGGLAVVWFNQIRTMGVGLITPLGNRIAEVHGNHGVPEERRLARIRQLSALGLLLTTVAGLAGALLMILIGWALPHLGQAPEIVEVAQPTMLALAPGLVPCLWFQAIRQFTVGLAAPQNLLRITLASVAVNLVLDLALAMGWGPLPALGAVGVGLATTVVHLLTAAVFIVLVRRDPVLGGFFATGLGSRADRAEAIDLRAQLRLGLPVSATYGAEAGMFSVVAMVMGSFGPAALAAHNVVYQVTFIVFQIGVGFSHGGSILVSRFLGSGDGDRIRPVGLHTAATMSAIAGVAALFFLATPRLVLAPFLSEPDPGTLALASGLLAIGALTQFADIGQNLGVGLLRGLGDTVTGLKASLIGYWAVGLPAALLLGFGAGLGPAGVWWGLGIGLATATALLWGTFWRITARL